MRVLLLHEQPLLAVDLGPLALAATGFDQRKTAIELEAREHEIELPLLEPLLGRSVEVADAGRVVQVHDVAPLARLPGAGLAFSSEGLVGPQRIPLFAVFAERIAGQGGRILLRTFPGRDGSC